MRVDRSLLIVMLVALYLLGVGVARADVYGKIRGTVTDPTGAAVPKTKIVATNTATGISTETVSGSDGNYEFLQLAAPAIYSLSAEAPGFEILEVDEIHLSLNQIFVENLSLKLGTVSSTVTVTEQAITQVETTSIELGTVINGTAIVNMPLNGRNWVDLQKLEPGVVEASDSNGNYATNGSQADQNSYLINGTDNNDLPLNTPQVIPSADAIAEFKMVTNTINPEYGRNSGAILNATIKSGTNDFHGDVFDFFRDTSLNAKNFFQPAPAVFHQNQFGGTIGGPIRKDRAFSFFSYQGVRQTRGESPGDCGCFSPGNATVFAPGQRNNGDFPDLATSSGVSASPLMGDDGNTYPAGTPYSTIFSNGQIPSADLNPVSVNLLKFVPPATVGSNFQFNPVLAGTGDQLLTRIDYTLTSKDTLWLYSLWERFLDTRELPSAGATLPGFAQIDRQHWQQDTVAWNHTLSNTMLNEVRIGYSRFNFAAALPQTPVSPSSVGFTGINPQVPSAEGIPYVVVNGLFNLGFSSAGPQPRIDQTYQFSDNLSKIAGKHSLKFGFDMRRFQVYNPQPAVSNNNGQFVFDGTGTFSTGDPGADFLLGAPDYYIQGSGDTLNERAQEYYLYAQDQWQARTNLTVTYGLGWSIDTPMTDIAHDNHAGVAFRPGQQSTVFGSAPIGYVFQGDAGVNAFGTTKFKHFGPRFGIAYSPDWGWLTGGAGKTSIRAGFGVYFNRFSGETASQTQGSPPFRLTSFGVGDIGASPSFANPFSGYMANYDNSGNFTGVSPVSIPNKFPYVPSATPDFSFFSPLSFSVYDPKITIPYAENFNLTIERQLDSSTVFSLAYVGSMGHKLLLAVEQNPGINPAGCLADPACSPLTGNPGYQPVLDPGDYAYPGSTFASIGQIQTTGNSNYNALQTTLNRQLSRGLQLMVAYTWSHALDNGSGFENSGYGGSSGGAGGGFGNLRSTNPFNQHLDYGPSSYDARQRLVISYVYEIPSIRHFGGLQRLPKQLTDGWQINGITTFQTGFPLDVVDSALPSLTASYYNFYSVGWAWDVPNVVGAPKYQNPRTNPTSQWFDPSTFAAPTPGIEGNAGRNLLRGPGRNNFDFALMKDTQITERTKIELRFEIFNLFNHTQFDPSGINTDFNSSNFGQEFAAHDPRIMQLAGKFFF